MKCRIKRNNQGQVTKVFNEKGGESNLFLKIAKHPLVKSTEEAVGIYKNVLSSKIQKQTAWVDGLNIPSPSKAYSKASIPNRGDLQEGQKVVVEPRRARGTTVEGTISEILTNSETHPYGILVRLKDGTEGRVKSIPSELTTPDKAFKKGAKLEHNGATVEVAEILGPGEFPFETRALLTDGSVVTLEEGYTVPTQLPKSTAYKLREKIHQTVSKLAKTTAATIDHFNFHASGKGRVYVRPFLSEDELRLIDKFTKNLSSEHKNIFKAALDYGGQINFSVHNNKVIYTITVGDASDFYHAKFHFDGAEDGYSSETGTTRKRYNYNQKPTAIVSGIKKWAGEYGTIPSDTAKVEGIKREKAQDAKDVKAISSVTPAERDSLRRKAPRLNPVIAKLFDKKARASMLEKVFPVNSVWYPLIVQLSKNTAVMNSLTLRWNTKTETNEGSDGIYDKNSISVNNYSYNPETTITHELVHGVTVETVEKYFKSYKEGKDYLEKVEEFVEKAKDSKDATERAVGRIAELYLESIDKSGNRENLEKNANKRLSPNIAEYGFTNLSEFISEGFTSVNFQDLLNNIQTEGGTSNIFTKLIELINDLINSFGIGELSEGSVLEELIKQTSVVMDSQEEARREVPVTRESAVGFVHNSPKSGTTTHSFKEALANAEEGDVIEIGFETQDGFQPVMTLRKNTDKDTEKGFVMAMIEAGYLSEEKQRVGTEYRFRAGGETTLAQALNAHIVFEEGKAHLGVGGVTKDGTTLTLEKTKGKVPVLKKDGSTELVDRNELDTMTYEELNEKYDNAQDIVVQREWYNSKVAYRDRNLEIPDSLPVRKEGELEMRLLNLLAKMGIKTVSIAEYLKNYKLRHGVDPSAKAIADIANEVIAYTKGEIGDLAEETAHFINEVMPQDKVENVLRNIHKTQEWAEHSARYREIYSKEYSGADLDAIVRREVLGKIVAKILTNENISHTPTETQRNIYQVVWDAITSFFNNLKGRYKADYDTELQQYLNEVRALLDAEDVNNHIELDNMKFNKFRFYNIYTSNDPAETLRKKARQIAFQLQDIEKQLLKAGGGTRTRIKDLSKIRTKLETALEVESIASLISIVNSSVKQIEAAIKDAKANENAYYLSAEENVIFQTLKGSAGAAVQEAVTLMTQLKARDKTNIWDALITEGKATSEKIGNLKAQVSLIDSNNVQRLVDHIMDKYNFPKEERQLVEKWIDKAEHDTNLFHSTFGQLVHAKDGLLNLQGYLLQDMHNYQQVKYYEATKRFQDKLAALGVTEEEIGRKFVDGQYIISPHDFNKFETDTTNIYLSSYRAAIADSIPKMEAQIQSGNLTAEAQAEFQRRITLYNEYLSKTDEEMKALYNGRELETLSIEEELFRKDFERPHMVQKIERVMKDSYYDKYEQKLKDAGIRDITRQELSNQLADISFFKRKAFSRIGGVLVMDFNTLSESEKLRYNELQKRRKMMKSYTNDLGQLKPGLGYKKVNGVIQLDAEGNPVVYEENPALMTDESIIAVDLHKLDATFEGQDQKETANLFYAALNKVDREEGREAALEFLRLNSFMTFAPEFWEGLKPSDSIVDRLRRADVAPEDQGTVDNLVNNITQISFEMKNIMKMFNSKGNPAEIEVEFMPEATKDTVKELQERLRLHITEAKRILGDPTEEKDDQEYLVGVSGTNVSYEKELKDLGIFEDPGDTGVQALQKANQELDFAKKHMVTFNANAVENVRVSILNFLEGNSFGVHSAAESVMEEFGITLDALRLPENQALVLREVARARVLPYYKRFTPEVYGEFEQELKTTPNLAQFLTNEASNSLKNQAFVQITPNHTFFSKEENDELNPNYDQEFRGGYLQPKKALYRNEKFYEMFGEIQINPETGEKFSTKNPTLYKAYEATLEYNEDSLAAMNVGDTYNQFLLPQIRKRQIERFSKVFSGNIRDNVKNWTKEAFTYTEDDLIQGEEMFGQDVKVIPKMYINRLHDPEDVSSDLFFSLSLRAKEAYGREARVKYYGDLMSVHDKILTRNMNGKDQKSSNTYKMAKSAIDYNLFGIKETATYPVKTPFGTFDMTKLARILLKYVKFRNLGINLIIPLTSWMTGEVTRKMEMYVGEFIDPRSQRLGNREFRRLVGSGMTEIGKINTKAKLNALGQYFQAFDLNDSFDNSNYKKWLRFLPRTGMMLHTAANYPIYGKTMLGVLHDYRVVEGRVMNKNDYFKLKKEQGMADPEIKSSWKAAEDKVIYKYIKHEGNKVELDAASLGQELYEEGQPIAPERVDDAVQEVYSTVQKHIQYVNSLVDGQIPEGDKVLAQRHFLLSYFMTHRGWLSIALARRFKSRHLNLQTRQVEEGSYISVWNYLGGFLREYKKSNFTKFFGSFKAAYVNAENDIERKNIMRVGIESAGLAALMVLALGLRYAAEDDENEDIFALQLANHVAYRTMNELSSVQLNIVSNMGEAIEAPFVGWNTVKNFTSIAQVFSGDEVQAGSYKGMTERGRFLTKMVPGAKQYFDLTNMNQTYDTYRFYNQRNFSLTPAAALWNQTIDEKD